MFLTRNTQINHAELAAAHHAVQPERSTSSRRSLRKAIRPRSSQIDLLVNAQAL